LGFAGAFALGGLHAGLCQAFLIASDAILGEARVRRVCTYANDKQRINVYKVENYSLNEYNGNDVIRCLEIMNQLGGGATDRALDLRTTGRGFTSYSVQSCVTTLGKLFTPLCFCH